jgi:2,4-dienoyl-CoA reductase-like NADH-dependent reductase (Old Yellow Enzyme family)
VDGLQCDALTVADIDELPAVYANAAAHAQSVGFSGVQIHAGHGFLLSQFLSPLFNHRVDGYGGPIEARCRLLIEIVQRTRKQVGSEFAIGVKINSSDGLEGGLSENDAFRAVVLLGNTGVDLIDISGGTYFPGAPSSSDRRSDGPYFLDFAKRARTVTDTPLMLTGGFKTRREAEDAVAGRATDLVGLARTMALDPDVASKWLSRDSSDPRFPSFESPPPGGITAWFTMRLTALADGEENNFDSTLSEAIEAYEARDAERIATWRRTFDNP